MTHASEEVLKFYRELPFNYSSTAAFEARRIRSTDVISGPYSFLLPLLRPGMRFLDVGCGVGWFGLSLAYHHHCQVTGLDFNIMVIERAREIAALLQLDSVFFEQDLFTYQPPSPYDLVSSQGVLHSTKNCHEAVRKVFRDFVRPGGHACIGLYHLYGRKPFLDYFFGLQKQGLSEEKQLAEFRRLNEGSGRETDAVFLKSWFRDQVLHPLETQHTLAEFIDLIEEENCDLVSTSINRFQPLDDLEAVLALEVGFEGIGRERLEQGRFYPGYFVFLVRKRA